MALPSRTRSAQDAVEAALEVVARVEPTVQAWAALDADGARAQAAAIDGGGEGGDRPLRGVTLGVKDVIDTADLPTAFGSPIYAGRRPARDASVVALLRAGGAIVLGKTHTAEFAGLHPPVTTNPHHVGHTPGGSSSGSAAAVAAGMVDAALGTQTAGSVVRPAAFCGVIGYKPTFGTISRAGVLECADSLDTVGVLARTVELAAAVVAVASGRPALGEVGAPAPWRVALLEATGWDQAEPAMRRAAQEAAQALAGPGGPAVWAAPSGFADALADHRVIMRSETARAFGHERAHHWDELSDELRALITEGLSVPEPRLVEAAARRRESGARIAQLFEEVDVVVLPAALGEAPAGLGSTGDPVFAAPWTMWGHPTLSLPWGVGPGGLPLGVQLVAAWGGDRTLLAAARHLADIAPATPVPPSPPRG